MSSISIGRGGRTSSTVQVKTRTGPPGTPPTWWRSTVARTCRRDRVGAFRGRVTIDRSAALAAESPEIMMPGSRRIRPRRDQLDEGILDLERLDLERLGQEYP